MSSQLPPVPYISKVTDADGILVKVWADWFKQLNSRVGGTSASTNAELSAITALVDPAGTGWTKNLATSGYQKLPSGLYLQWGVTGSLASGTATAITLPVACPTGLFQVVAGLRDMSGASTSDTGQFGTGEYSTTGFKIYNRTASSYTFNWFAVGY